MNWSAWAKGLKREMKNSWVYRPGLHLFKKRNCDGNVLAWILHSVASHYPALSVKWGLKWFPFKLFQVGLGDTLGQVDRKTLDALGLWSWGHLPGPWGAACPWKMRCPKKKVMERLTSVEGLWEPWSPGWVSDIRESSLCHSPMHWATWAGPSPHCLSALDAVCSSGALAHHQGRLLGIHYMLHAGSHRTEQNNEG